MDETTPRRLTPNTHIIDRHRQIVPSIFRLRGGRWIEEPDYDALPAVFQACTCGSSDDIIWPTQRVPDEFSDLKLNGTWIDEDLADIVYTMDETRREKRKLQAKANWDAVKKSHRSVRLRESEIPESDVIIDSDTI